MNQVINELNRVYFEHETWQEPKLPEEEIARYHEKLLEKNRISVCMDGDRLLGYVESWRITREQFGRLVLGEKLSALQEDVETGPIAYCASIWVHPEWRHSSVITFLRNEFFRKNFSCEYIVGESVKKRQPIHVYKRNSKMFERFLRSNKDLEIINGQS